jgi:hypothetical protein
MDANTKAILEQLKANKSRKANHEGATRRLGTKPKKTRHKKFSRKQLGKLVGHCPNCQIVLGDKEVDTYETDGSEVVYCCSRCGIELPHKQDLPQHVDLIKFREWRQHDKWGDSSVLAPIVTEKMVSYAFPIKHNY